MARSKPSKAKRAVKQPPPKASATPPQSAKVKLNKTGVEGIAPPATGERVVWDSELRGFGIRVSCTGKRTFFVYGRTVGGRQIKIKIDVYGRITAEKARERASIELGKLAAGQDPSEERRQAREAERARRVAPTMQGLADEYMTAHAKLHKRPTSIKNDQAMLDKIILPRLGSKRVAHVTHKDIATLHGELNKTPYVANRVVALLSTMFGLAIQWQMRADNPAKGITRYQEEPRERYLRPDEVARLTDVLATHPNRAHANAVRLLLLTGARRGEVLSATWSQIDFDTGTWTKPSSHTKQKKLHSVPLSPQALRLLTDMRSEAEAAWAKVRRQAKAAGRIAKPSPFIFPVDDGHLTDVKTFWAAACAEAGIEGVRLHDLRHTFASTLAGEKLPLTVIGALLGHSNAATTQRYSHLIDSTLREATAAAAAKFDEYAKAPRKGKLVTVKP